MSDWNTLKVYIPVLTIGLLCLAIAICNELSIIEMSAWQRFIISDLSILGTIYGVALIIDSLERY